MKIVIDIDDEQVLFDIKNRGLEGESETDKVIINSLYNGTPLPKGHGRLIDADKLEPRDISPDAWYSPLMGFELDDIEDAPTIIEADKEIKE